MTAVSAELQESPRWLLAAACAGCAHVVVATGIIGWSRPVAVVVAEPVVLVEMPPAASSPVVTHQQPAITQPLQSSGPRPPAVEPVPEPQQVPELVAPSPPETVAAVEPPVLAAAALPVVQQSETPQVDMPVPDARARRQQADYFALVSAHLNRRKSYPAAARKALQQGVVTVRFTVDRKGNVSGVSIKQGSGHQILDQVTLELLQRVSPLPPMPASLQRDEVTLSLPIEYALRTR